MGILKITSLQWAWEVLWRSLVLFFPGGSPAVLFRAVGKNLWMESKPACKVREGKRRSSALVEPDLRTDNSTSSKPSSPAALRGGVTCTWITPDETFCYKSCWKWAAFCVNISLIPTPLCNSSKLHSALRGMWFQGGQLLLGESAEQVCPWVLSVCVVHRQARALPAGVFV